LGHRSCHCADVHLRSKRTRLGRMGKATLLHYHSFTCRDHPCRFWPHYLAWRREPILSPTRGVLCISHETWDISCELINCKCGRWSWDCLYCYNLS